MNTDFYISCASSKKMPLVVSKGIFDDHSLIQPTLSAIGSLFPAGQLSSWYKRGGNRGELFWIKVKLRLIS
jgi:hypothetical protein